MSEFADNVAARTTDDISEFVATEMEPLALKHHWSKEETMDILMLIVKVVIETMHTAQAQTMEIVDNVFTEQKGGTK